MNHTSTSINDKKEFLKKFVDYLVYLRKAKELLKEDEAELGSEQNQEQIMQEVKQHTKHFVDFVKQSGFIDEERNN